MSTSPSPAEVEELLAAAGAGDEHATDALLRTLFRELRGLARAQLGRLPPGQTLQPTALVNEAYLRLVGREATGWQDRKDFLFLAARAMHDVLVEEARRKASAKRGGAWRRLSDVPLELATESTPEDVLALDEGLRLLAETHPRKAELVRLRFFVGLTEPEVADVLGVSLSTVNREWRFARAWLYDRLGDAEEDARA